MSKKVQIKKLIEKIEGEATLNFHYEDNKISFVDISFLSGRGIEEILRGRVALDALMIAPRVCGICGHAHLQASVKAVEDCLPDLKISKKAEILRELTLNFELMQNHFKWFYLTLFPLFGFNQEVLKATKPSTLINKAIALIAGQYPHNSYAIVGGVVCEPTHIEMLQIRNILNEVLAIFEKDIVVANTREFLGCDDVDLILKKEGDLPKLLNKILQNGWQDIGKSFDRFIVFGNNSYFKRGKSIITRIQPHIDEKYIYLSKNINSLAKNVSYKDKYYEVGPLSRAMLLKTPLIKASHRRYSDSLFSRILARSCEIVQLLYHSLKLIDKIDLSQPSYIKPSSDLSKLTGAGVGAVEAARGSLTHKVELEEGIIKDYSIITPTQWNLSNGTPKNPGVSQKAMVGSKDELVAELIFKSFDVCSVCTTH